MNVCNISLQTFGSKPQIAKSILREHLDDYQGQSGENNCWEGLFSVLSTNISSLAEKSLPVAEHWAEVMELLVEKVANSPYYQMARVHRLRAAIVLLHYHGVDASSSFRNPNRWIVDFERQYKYCFVDVENFLVKHLAPVFSESFCDSFTEELSLLASLNQYPMDDVCRSLIERWVNLWISAEAGG